MNIGSVFSPIPWPSVNTWISPAETTMVDHRLLTAVRRMPDLHRTQVLVRRAVAIRGLLLETALLVRVRLLALPAAVPPLLVLAINGHQASKA